MTHLLIPPILGTAYLMQNRIKVNSQYVCKDPGIDAEFVEDSGHFARPPPHRQLPAIISHLHI
ncbi:MAG: hypothetical protein H0U43_02960 [Chthoniobacterales bacterium]|nr:hypothetical protein [Chthoniobacterales bacterium]